MWDLGDTQQQSSWQCAMARGRPDPIRISSMATAQKGRCLVQHNYRNASSALVIVQEGKL